MNATTIFAREERHGARPDAPPARRPSLASGIVIATVVALCALGHLWPGAHAALTFERSRIDAGEWWKLFTGSLVHFDAWHCIADVGAFAVVYWLASRKARGAVWVVVASAIAIGAAVYLWARQIAVYKGISGVNFALLNWLLVTMAMQQRGRAGVLFMTVVVGLMGKSVYEMATGRLLVQTCLPEGVAVVGVAHMAGLVVGAAMALAAGSRLFSRRRVASSCHSTRT